MRLRCAIIEDLRPDAQALERALLAASAHSCRLQCTLYASGNEFLRRGALSEQDVIFLDIDIPGMSGMDIAHKIRETRPDVIIIFCTNLQQFALNGYEVDAFGFIVKPIKEYSFDFFMDKAIKKLARMRRGGVAFTSRRWAAARW